LGEGAVEERGERRGMKGRVYDILCSSLRCIKRVSAYIVHENASFSYVETVVRGLSL